MSSSSSPASVLSGRIDRRDLVHDRQVWLIYAIVFAVVGVATLLIGALWPDLYHRERLWPFGAYLLLVALAAGLTKPPGMGSAWNHVNIFTVSGSSALGILAYAPSSAAPVVAAIFSGTFAAGRLVDRRQVLAHYVAGAAVVIGAAVVAHVDQSTVLALAGSVPAVWVLGWTTTLVLEAAEAQSRDLALMIRRDPLTGVGNRRQLEETLATELTADGTHEPAELSLLALDLNGFKAINDQLGHDAGDALLVAVARALSGAARATDMVVRQGGDEFCVVLPRTGAAEAQAMAARMGAALAELGDVSSGIGVATFPAEASGADELLALADARLSADKAAVRATVRRTPEVDALAAAAEAALADRPDAELSASGRVSRAQLAINLTVWRAQGVLVGVYGSLLAGIAMLTLDGADPQRTLFGVCIALAVITYVSARREPPAVGTALNHVVVSLPYVGATAVMLISPQVAAAALGPLALSGALAGVRLVHRRAIAAHWSIATCCVVGLIASGTLPVPMILALALTVLLIWGIGLGDVVYLEQAEAQGDELERLVRRDPLTGLGNLRLLDEVLAEEVSRFSRTGKPFSLLALDLNGFKALNDALGHGAGDELLQDVAAALTEATGESDVVARQGGDEFCIVLPGADAAKAVPTANAVRAAVAGLGRGGHRITTGVGIATFPDDAHAIDVLRYVADERLLLDKHTSRPLAERRGAPRGESPPGEEPGPPSLRVMRGR